MYRPNPAMKRKNFFFARVEWLSVTYHSHRRTDKFKISIMILKVVNLTIAAHHIYSTYNIIEIVSLANGVSEAAIINR